MLKGFIYKITNNINNKIYIGKTHQNPPEKRWKQHQGDFKRGTKNTKLVQAVNELGINNFKFEVIDEDTYKYPEQLDLKEWEYIQKYDSYNNGYNSDEGNNINKSSEMKIMGQYLDDIINFLKEIGEHKFFIIKTKELPLSVQGLTLLGNSEELQKGLNIKLFLEQSFNEVCGHWEAYDRFQEKMEKTLSDFYL